MVKKNERFRVLNEKFPQIGEQILQLWGKSGLIAYINRVLDDARESPALGFTTRIELALYGLRKEHELEFGRQPEMIDGQVITDNEHFKKINAQYPRIGKQVVDLWGRPGFNGFINKLLQDTRGGMRQGFSPDVAAALFKLMQKHDQDFPKHALKIGDIWTGGKAL